ncbi:hypothetical protein AMR42_02985 [Limnothrix sp. PR1529]|uniref:ATP-dependent nuclease n=1 Tax=Limnothrix sp. PR1529 TaxID=1704291 RepID=UPI00081F1ECA|nr:ATP-binding protein [Limnothrix sp. PR1529]OCQ96738.1 hypothetical protein BCR12_08240 [Limnothrix sp. P13C2]PIB15090.1 hypothetical protein AMR42_02985 [Limnothrix sp. PR1529]
MSIIRINSVRFLNFKAFKDYSIRLQDMNILVGPNNSGKSTIINAFRILSTALRRACSRSPERISTSSLSHPILKGHRILQENIGVPLENISNDYNDQDSSVEFKLTNKNKLILLFPSEGGCILTWETPEAVISSPKKFKQEFPINIQVVPVLGPLESNEILVNENTVKSALNTHRASRHFRNYWIYFPENWDNFADLVSKTWTGMEIKRPELLNDKVSMFCTEDRITREIYWSGFGFQIWCQLLTHLSRSREASIVIIDEPEIYLHPDVQRQLLGILRSLDADVLLATHSLEIMSEADPSEILLVDKRQHNANRLKDIEGIQKAVESLGSAQNITLTQLARTRKIIFTEGSSDYKIIKRFASRLGYRELASGNNLTHFESGGFSSRDEIRALSRRLSSTLGANIPIAAIYDRDFCCDEEIEEILKNLRADLQLAVIHKRKEIENYLLVPSVLEIALDKAIRNREQRSLESINRHETIADILDRITSQEKNTIQGQYITKRIDFLRKTGKDQSTITTETINWFDRKWQDMHKRMEIISGKKVLKALRDELQEKYSVTLTDFQIIHEFSRSDIPNDLVSLIEKLECFRISS